MDKEYNVRTSNLLPSVRGKKLIFYFEEISNNKKNFKKGEILNSFNH